MPFKKGTSGNPVGRPKGSGNNELRNIINESINMKKDKDKDKPEHWMDNPMYGINNPSKERMVLVNVVVVCMVIFIIAMIIVDNWS